MLPLRLTPPTTFLQIVAAARLFSVFTGYIRPQTFSETVFTKALGECCPQRLQA